MGGSQHEALADSSESFGVSGHFCWSGYAAARTADACLRGDRPVPLLYQAMIDERARRAWDGLAEAYGSFEYPEPEMQFART